MDQSINGINWEERFANNTLETQVSEFKELLLKLINHNTSNVG